MLNSIRPSGDPNQDWNEKLENWTQWEELIDFIEDEKCILMLGPEVSISPLTNEPYTRVFARELAENLGEVSEEFPNLTRAVETYKRRKTDAQFKMKVNRFYRRNGEVSEIHNDIAKLPFPLIINTSPDLILMKAFDNPLFDYYNFKESRKDPAYSGQADIPLIYNLFGSATEPESLVLTEQDRLDFLVKVIKGSPPLPKNLLSEKIMNNENMFLFIGFNFREWYLKMLMKLLSLNNNRFACAIEKYRPYPDQEDRVFYTNNFNFNFVDVPFRVFLQRLVEKYEIRRKSHISFLPPIMAENENKEEAAQKQSPIQVFLSASNKDMKDVLDFEKILAPLILQKKIITFHIGKIKSGVVQEQVAAAIARSGIFVLFLSPDSLIHNIQAGMLDEIIAKKEKDRQVQIVPVILKECLYNQVKSLDGYDKFPKKDGLEKAVYHTDWSEKSDAFCQVADYITNLIQ